MLGFKNFDAAQRTLAGIEVMAMIKKGQMKIRASQKQTCAKMFYSLAALGYIDLPSSGLLVNYQMLNLAGTDTEVDEILDPRLPDVRNTLYWNPDLELTQETGQRISFRTADLKGNYEILIRGIDSTGKYLEKRVPFRVK